MKSTVISSPPTMKSTVYSPGPTMKSTVTLCGDNRGCLNYDNQKILDEFGGDLFFYPEDCAIIAMTTSQCSGSSRIQFSDDSGSADYGCYCCSPNDKGQTKTAW